MSLKHFVKKNFPALFGIASAIKNNKRNKFVEKQKTTLAAKVAESYKNDPEASEVISYLQSDGIQMIPYYYTNDYRKTDIQVKRDTASGLPFVVVNNKNIYFPAGMTDEYIIDSVKVGLMEQDDRSPHKYLPVGDWQISGDAAIVCGASDCIYTLSIIDRFQKVFLFEANKDWLPAINLTLKGYEDKFEIVPFYISDEDGPGTIRLDTFLRKHKNQVNYIQADIEGAELKMLKGATHLLDTAKNINMSLCCYHTAEQEKEITDFLAGKGYSISHSKGFLLMFMDYPLRPPYLRRGIVYAKK